MVAEMNKNESKTEKTRAYNDGLFAVLKNEKG